MNDMRKLKAASGPSLLAVFGKFGFVKLSQRGSHAKLRRETPGGRQTLTVPLHKELDKGTLLALFRQGCRYISENELAPYFFTD
jgi:predicted RNA binding protein YcfA (HicA-like mRNA interferase family)